MPKDLDPTKASKYIKNVPTTDIDAEPKTQDVIDFLYDIMVLPIEDDKIMQPLMQRIFLEHTTANWMRSAKFNCMKTLIKIINWMTRRPDWITFKGNLGKMYSDDMEEHIRYFKMFAMCKGRQRESDDTKQLFLESIKPLTLMATKENGSFKTFNQIINMASAQKKQFNHMANLEKEVERLKHESVVTAAILSQTQQNLNAKKTNLISPSPPSQPTQGEDIKYSLDRNISQLHSKSLNIENFSYH